MPRPMRAPVPAVAGKQGGHTLIELSVAMLIALFLLGGVLAMEQSTRRSYGNQTDLSQLQDSERLAMTLINDVIQSAGYFPNPTVNSAASALPPIPGFAQNQAISGVYSATAPTDTISVRYMTDSGDNVLLCDGSTNTSGGSHTYVNTFSVDNVTHRLVCTLGTDAVGTGAPVELVDKVRDLQVWYGVKRGGAATDNNVDTYVRADGMVAADWPNVTSVKVRVVFANPLAGQAGQAAGSTIPFERVVSVMGRTGVTTP